MCNLVGKPFSISFPGTSTSSSFHSHVHWYSAIERSDALTRIGHGKSPANMIWIPLCFILTIYFILALLALLIIPARIAKPPWHVPRPGKQLSIRGIPSWWQGATDPHQLNLNFEHVSFRSYANLTLRGWLIPFKPNENKHTISHDPSEIAIACVHGAGRDRRAFLRHSVFLAEAGYDVLLFDCSNHGASDSLPAWPQAKWPGRAVSLGRREHLDVKAAAEFLTERGAKSVVVLGTSQGASSAIVAAAKCQSIKLLVLENPFVSPSALVEHIVDIVLSRIPIPFFGILLAPRITWLSLFRTGNAPARHQMRAIDFVRDLAIPMLFIHGTADLLVHFGQSKALYDTARHPEKGLWIVEGAEHTRCYEKEPQQFRRRVLDFLDTYLPKSQSQELPSHLRISTASS